MKTNKKKLSAILVGAGIIAFWRGIWGLLDIYLFPNNYELSLWASLAIGLGVLLFTHHLIKEFIE